MQPLHAVTVGLARFPTIACTFRGCPFYVSKLGPLAAEIKPRVLFFIRWWGDVVVVGKIGPVFTDGKERRFYEVVEYVHEEEGCLQRANISN